MDYSKITLGELLSSENETIKRNAVSVLKKLQNGEKIYCPRCKKTQVHYHWGNFLRCSTCKDLLKK